MSNSKNPDCARAQYIQAQTETGNLPQKARTPLISPKDATALAPDEFIDRVLGTYHLENFLALRLTVCFVV